MSAARLDAPSGTRASSVGTNALTGGISCAFVGLIAPDGRVAENAAYSPAGAQFQESLLGAMAGTQVAVNQIYALRPVASYPSSRRLIFRTEHSILAGGIPATLIPFVNFGPLKTLTSGATLFPRLIAWAWRNRRRPRALILYNLYSPPGLVSVIAGRLTRTRVFAVVGDIQVPGAGLLPDTPLRRLDYQLQVRTLPHFDGLVVLTRAMADDFAPATPHIQMEGAVPDALTQPIPGALKSRQPDDARPIVIMYAGGLSELKGIPLLLAAFAKLDGDDYTLWITGRGPLEGAVAQAAASDQRIRYWGFPSSDELLELYSAADVLVNPHSATHASARYLFPSKLIEYLATGVPVVSTCSTPGVAEEYGRAAIVMATDSAAELASQIRRLSRMSPTERCAIGTRGREFVLREKTWAMQGQRIAGFIAGVVGDRTSPVALRADEGGA